MGTEFNTYEDARNELTAWLRVISRIDRALCRRGGHPDEAWWIDDRPLHEALIGVHSAISKALGIIRIREDIQSYRAIPREEGEEKPAKPKRGRPRKKSNGVKK